MKYLSTSDVKKMKSISNFNPVIDSRGGTIEWHSDDSKIIIYATPNWKVEGTCPFAYSIGIDGEHINVATLEFTGMDITTQHEKYIETIEKIIVEYGEKL